MRLLLLAVLLIGVQNNPAPKNPNGKTSNNPPSNGQPAIAEIHASSPVEAATGQTQQQTTPAEVQPFMTHGEYVISAITGLYVIVSFLTFLAVRNTVKVSQLQTKATVNSSRPWIAIKIKEPPAPNEFTFEAICLSGTPAKIIHNYADLQVIDSSKSPQPVYKTDMMQYPRIFANTDGKFKIYDYSIESVKANVPQWAEIQSLQKTLYFFGKIEYVDGVSFDDAGKHIIHESRWCFEYNIGGHIFRSGPLEMNDFT
jgi:hypothetical protein